MIAVENISKSFGDQVLFENASFKINARERVGLVGRNGHGKTTLLRMLIGVEEVESGTIIIPRNYQIGYVRQHIEFTEKTVLEEGMRGLREEERDSHWKVEKILAGLGFSPADMQRDPANFSGGYQVRLNLAKILVAEPDLLLLDEPTNYLDITSIRWIERFLLNWPHELMLITHDRNFMDNVVTHIIGIHRRKMRKMEGNTAKFYTQIAQDEEIFEKTRINDEKKRKEIEQFVNRFRAKARLANMVQSRVKALAKREKHEKLESLKDLEFSFHCRPLAGKQVMSVQNIHFSYQAQPPLIQGVDIVIGARDRVCIIGQNGRGKTTLLKLLAGLLPPKRGQIQYHPGVLKGVFEQTNVTSLVDARTIEEEICYSHSDVDRQRARNICGAMMFEGDAALKKIGVLSGGEKSRVMLGKLLAVPLNLLLLDEPTNHLDMESCDALLAAIDSFDGAVIMVTHNEMFLHALAERLIVFQNDGVNVFEGGYQDFLDRCGWEDERIPKPESAHAETNQGNSGSGEKISKKEKRRLRSEIISKRSRAIAPLEKQVAEIEAEIEVQDQNLDAYNAAMQEAAQSGDGAKIGELSLCIHKSQSAIDRLFDHLAVMTEQLDAKRGVFQKQLEQLEQDC